MDMQETYDPLPKGLAKFMCFFACVFSGVKVSEDFQKKKQQPKEF